MSCNKEGKKKHVFTWKIINFNMCPMKKGEKLLSPTFNAISFDETAWYLAVYPRGDKKANDGFTSLYLRRKEDDAVPFAIECDYKLEVLNEKGHIVLFVKGAQKFEKGASWGTSTKTDKFVKGALHDDTLTLRCTLSKNIPEKNFYSQNTSTTQFKIRNQSFQLKINNLSSLTQHEVIKFPCLKSSQLEITFQIPEDDVKIFIAAVIESSSSSKFILCNFKLLDVAGKERQVRRETHLFEKDEPWEFPAFIKMNKLNSEKDLYINEGCFTLQCDITISDGSIEEDGIWSMYDDKIHTDIKLKGGENVFPVHKSILCAVSLVFLYFLAMFYNDMTEGQKGEVGVPDIEGNTVDLLLEYMYTGTLNDLDYEHALKLIVVAEKYKVVPLKNKCAELLEMMLSHVNVCEILLTADLVQHDTLKASVLTFIKQQPKKIFRSEEWNHFTRNNLLLAIETASEVAIMMEDLVKEQSDSKLCSLR